MFPFKMENKNQKFTKPSKFWTKENQDLFCSDFEKKLLVFSFYLLHLVSVCKAHHTPHFIVKININSQSSWICPKGVCCTIL